MLSEKLKAYRKVNDLTQEELAVLLNVSRSAVAKWEQNRGIPLKEIMYDISKILQISEDMLLDDDESVIIINNILRASKKTTTKLSIFLIITLVAYILSFSFLLAYSSNRVINKSVSPDGSITLNVYTDSLIKEYFSDQQSYTIEVTGEFRGIWGCEECIFQGLYWSHDSRFVVHSYYHVPTQKTWLDLTDFSWNSGTNFRRILEIKLSVHYGFDVEADFQFLQWSDEDNMMLVKYSFTNDDQKIIGYFWSTVLWGDPLLGLTEIEQN